MLQCVHFSRFCLKARPLRVITALEYTLTPVSNHRRRLLILRYRARFRNHQSRPRTISAAVLPDVGPSTHAKTAVVRERRKSEYLQISIKGIQQNSESFGDTLREIQEMNIFKSDFLVVRGDIITNIDLQEAIKYHFEVKALEEKKENKTTDTPKLNTIMTKIFLDQSQDSPLSHVGN